MSCSGRKTLAGEELFEQFQIPPAESRPFFRWWWNGNHLSREEISRELRIIKDSGAGGVEINPIAMPGMVEDPHGEGLTWLSDEWCEMLVHAVEEARQLGLVTDLIVGTGWPFGAEFLEPEETIQGLTIEEYDYTGPGIASLHLEVPQDENHRIEQIVLIPFAMKNIDQRTDLTGELNENGDLTFTVPDGEHKLIVLRWKNKFRTVFHGAPGGAGPVLDHFNREAVKKYLDSMSGKIAPFLEGNLGNGIRAMFCDSIELEGANWTGDFPGEFEKRRGYSVIPYLPLLIDDTFQPENEFQDTLRRVRYDHSLTLAELFMERFILTFHEWCNENRTLSRYQAYGHPWLYTDMIDGYRVPDIPEGDQWLYNAGWSYTKIDEIRYAIWNKYASSGGHLAGRKIISSEAMTNTSGVFRASLEYIREATDLNIVAGINHLVLHGFNYSPPEAGFPGWIRYGTYFNENNTWWPYFPLWSDYASRLSTVFQSSEPVCTAAIMGPTADIWSDHGLDRNPFNTIPWYLHSFWQALSHNGIFSDYVNERAILEADSRDGRMTFGPMAYDTLFICDVETVAPEVLEKIYDLMQEGLKVVFIGKTPRFAPGMRNMELKDRDVRQLFTSMKEAGAEMAEAPDSEKVDPYQGLTTWTRDLAGDRQIAGNIYIEPASQHLFFIHHRSDTADIFFFTNTDRESAHSFTVDFKMKNRSVWEWVPETGERHLRSDDSAKPYTLELERLESSLVVLGDQPAGEVPLPKMALTGEEKELRGRWQVSLLHSVTGEESALELSELKDVASMEGYSGFSGMIRYELAFDLDEISWQMLDLGEVHDIADVTLNGEKLKVLWWGKKAVQLPERSLKQGGNRLVINVTNRLFNYCDSLDDNPVASHWIESNRHKEPLAAGLTGPVKLVR